MADMPIAFSMQELVDYMRSLTSAHKLAVTKALLVTVQRAEAYAKKNYKEQFTGRNDRTVTGGLLNAIYSGVEHPDGEKISGFIGTRNIPYGAIHEFGGIINPRPENKMQRLWIPVYANAGKMTPKEFIEKKRANPSMFFLNDKVAGTYLNKKTKKITPLFFLVKQAVIPERPYLTPAIELAADGYMTQYERFLGEGKK